MKLIVGIALFGGFIWLDGSALQSAWNWFAAPLGARTISWPHAIGLNSLVWLFIYRPQNGEVPRGKAAAMRFVMHVIQVIALWLVAYLAALYMGVA